MKIRTYKKRPVKIRAMHWSNHTPAKAIAEFCDGEIIRESNSSAVAGVLIETLEGNMMATRGDYVIEGVNKEFYPCKPDIFVKTYVEVKS